MISSKTTVEGNNEVEHCERSDDSMKELVEKYEQ